MKNIYLYPILYLLLYTISGCNYKVFEYLKDNPLLFIGLYSLITVIVMYFPIYSFVEKRMIASNENQVQESNIKYYEISQAFSHYGLAILLSIVCSVGWQIITYGFLINQGLQGALLALLVTSLSRILEPILSVYIFGDKINNHIFYWIGLVLSIVGIIVFQLASKQYDNFSTLSLTYYLVSFINLFFLVGSSIIKRFITSNPVTDTIPIRKNLLGIIYKRDYFIPIRLRAFIIDFVSGIILCAGGLTIVKTITISNQQIMALLWIGIIGGISFNLAMRIKNLVSNTVTTVLDSFRPIGLFFIFPIIPFIFSLGNDSYSLTFDLQIIFGLFLCFLGGYISIQFGKPEKSKNNG